MRFGDDSWHELDKELYILIQFKQDSSLTIRNINSNLENGKYFVAELDSIIHLSTNYEETWEIISFEKEQFSVITARTREGGMKAKLFRIE